MQTSPPWYVPALLVLGIISLLGSGVCLALYFFVGNELEQLSYLACFFIFAMTAFFSLSFSKVTLVAHSCMRQHNTQ